MVPGDNRDSIMLDSDHVSLDEIGMVDAAPEPDFDHITAFVAALTHAPVALVSIVEPSRDRQFFKSMHGLAEPWRSRRQTPLSHSFCKHVRATGRPLIVNDARLHPLVKDNGAVPDLGVIAYLGVPIHDADDKPVGALCAIDGEPRAWNAGEVETLCKLAQFVDGQIQLRSALKNSERRRARLTAEIEARKAAEEKLRTLASTDPLTGVANRRVFTERAEAELARCNRRGGSVSLITIDLDHFKRVNDTHGHDAGDAVLKAVTRRISNQLRDKIDLLTRIGGEEFVVLVPDMAAPRAAILAERFRRVVANDPVTVGRDIQLAITASFGVAASTAGMTEVHQLLKLADEALYAAKAGGRNRVEIAGDLIAMAAG
jgi:diguanylate cyclase (GGDEF)-like protein